MWSELLWHFVYLYLSSDRNLTKKLTSQYAVGKHQSNDTQSKGTGDIAGRYDQATGHHHGPHPELVTQHAGHRP